MQCYSTPILCWFLTYISQQINYQTPEDLASPQTLQNNDHYDFIIVGAGPAGSLLANRLSAVSKWKILLLEAGGDEPEWASVPAYTPYMQTTAVRTTVTWPVETDERFCGGKMCPFDGGFGLGGGTIHNEMIYNRCNKDIYNTWAELGNKGWGYDEVLPFFKKWENNLDADIANNTKYHSVGGEQSVGRWPYTDVTVKPFLEGFKELGLPEIDMNAQSQEGVTHIQFFQNNGARVSANHAFLTPIRERKNLKIITNARVTKIIMEKNGKRALGVEYASEKTRKTIGKVYAKKEVIISAGAIKSPQILLLSGIGPENKLKSLGISVMKNLPGVGHDFQNHNRIDLNLEFMDGNGTMPKNDEEALADFIQYETNHTGPLSGQGAWAINAYIHSSLSDPKKDMPDIQLLFGPTHSFEDYAPSTFVIPHSYYDRIRCVVYAVLPKSRGYITINSTDPFADPLIKAFNNTIEEDYTVMVDGGMYLQDKFFQTNGFKQLGAALYKIPSPKCNEYKFGSRDYWMCYAKHYARPSRHYGGSCRMGPDSDPNAVVDSKLKVYGIPNLRVVDASIMPLLVNGNTNAPVLMIAEKAAHMIIKEHFRRNHSY